jgi:hypothetical protein
MHLSANSRSAVFVISFFCNLKYLAHLSFRFIMDKVEWTIRYFVKINTNIQQTSTTQSSKPSN